jgi:Rad3-related DNA helicase
MSGTLFEPDIKELVPGEDYGYASFESPIPLERRPVLYRPIADAVNYQTPPAEIAAAIEKVVQTYPEQNMLVNLSYSDTRSVGDLLRVPHITHTKGTKSAVLRAFKQNGGVLLAAGCAVGIDLPDDLCRVIYIPRLLKPNLGDPAVKKRKALAGGQEWYDFQVIKTAVQALGRGARHEKDFCLGIIGDPAFSRLILKYYDKLPISITEAIQWA